MLFTGTNSTPRLVIALVSHTHEGKWQCEATNSIGTSQGTMMSVDVKRKLSILFHCILPKCIVMNKIMKRKDVGVMIIPSRCYTM